MVLQRPYSLAEIAALISGEAYGDAQIMATGINEIHVVCPQDIVFVDHPKYYDATLRSSAAIVIINKVVDVPSGKALVVHSEPFAAFNALLKHFKTELLENQDSKPEIAPGALVMKGAHLGNYVRVGKYSVIHPGVVVYDHCVIGDNVIIHANSVIGSDAFYYKQRPEYHDKLASFGSVVIENNVEIGACCTIDRGTTGNTIIGEGTKMDNHVHIGHDTIIGKHCLFAAQVGIAGCVKIGDRVIMWGQSGCAANVEIGQGAVIFAQSGVARSLQGGQSYFGSPAIDSRIKMREIAAVSALLKKS